MKLKLAYIFLACFLTGKSFSADAINFRAISIGSENAPHTVIEYTSLTCHHCADFHMYVLPLIKQKYINSGQLRWIIIPYPMDKDALKAFEMINFLPTDKQEDAMLKMFSSQKLWIGKSPEVAGKMIGLSKEDSLKAVSNTEVENSLLAGSYHAQKELNVNATPTFFLAGKKYEGAMSIKEFDATFEEAVLKSKEPEAEAPEIKED